jgi:hypothetical protein
MLNAMTTKESLIVAAREGGYDFIAAFYQDTEWESRTKFTLNAGSYYRQFVDDRLLAAYDAGERTFEVHVSMHTWAYSELYGIIRGNLGLEYWTGWGWDGHNGAYRGTVTRGGLNLLASFASPEGAYPVGYSCGANIAHVWLLLK